MKPISLCTARKKRDEQLAEKLLRQPREEALRKHLTLGLNFVDPPPHKLGPHFAWAFLEPQWIKDILEQISMFREFRSKVPHLEEMIFRDYLIHYALGDIEQCQETSAINHDLEEELYMLLPLEWDSEDAVPNFRFTPVRSLLVVSDLGVHWRIPQPPTGTPTFHLNTNSVPFEWFEEIFKTIK